MIFRAFKKVFARPRVVVYALIAAGAGYVLMAWLFELRLVTVLMAAPIAWGQKISVLFSLAGTIGSNTAPGEYVAMVLLSILFGIQVSLSLYTFKQTRAMRSTGVWGGIIGFVGGFLGMGCLACGTFVLAPLFSLLGAGAALSVGSIGGLIPVAVGIGALVASIIMTLRSIDRPLVCAPSRLQRTDKTE